MKIIAINGSHKGKNGNTDIMVNAFSDGARIAGAETENIFLSDKNIQFCLACKSCWFKTPGKCVLKDDVPEIIQKMQEADIVILATPVYCDNISSKLKTLIDRTLMTASPYWSVDEQGECRHLQNNIPPKLIMMANCGYPERSHFQVISNWAKRYARNLNTQLLCEIYTPQGSLLSFKDGQIGEIVANYLKSLEQAGKEIATNLKLDENTNNALKNSFIPNNIYVNEVKKYVDKLLVK